jgi:peptide/nickel transport system substrate-binding protein
MQDNPYDPGSPYIPGLAYGWTVDADLQGVTFYLKDNAQWHNGAPFVCEDARFSYETMITGEGITRPYMQNRLSNVILAELECLDDYTLQFKFDAPSAVPLINFGHVNSVIFNKEWFIAGGEDAMFQDVSLGTGPFMWGEGQDVGIDEQHFDKNPNYHFEGLPYVDEVVIFGILDETAQQATMLARQTDWHWVRNFGQYKEYVDHDQIQTVIRATRSSENLWINTRNAPLDNVRIRQAIAMGMDRVSGINVALSGYGSQGLGLMPPGSLWAADREATCAIPGWCEPADMEAQRAEAIQILKEEGFDFDKTYVLTVESDAQRVNRATFMQEQLRLLGIKTDFDTVETVAYRQLSQTGKWGDFLSSTGGVSGVDDPFIGLGHYHRCDSLYNFQTPGTDCDATTEGLFEELSKLTAYEDRKAKGQEIQLYLMSIYWNFPAFWEQEAVAFWPEVRGYVHYPGPTSSHLRWAHMWIDPSLKDNTGFSGQTTGVPGGE